MNSGLLFTFLFLGAGLYGSTFLLRPVWQWFWDKVWLRAYQNGARRGFTFRVRFVLEMMRFPLLSIGLYCIFFLTIFVILASQMSVGLPGLGYAIAMTLGYFAIPILVPKLFDFRGIPVRNMYVAILAAKRLATLAPEHAQQRMLEWASTFPENWIRIAALNGYMEITQPWSLKAVERMEKDPDSDVRQAGKEASALLYALLYGSGARSLIRLETMLKQYDFLAAKTRGDFSAKAKSELQQYIDAIDDVVYSQLRLREAYPHLYCKQCMARAEWMKHGEWEWVRCKRCHDVSDLQAGVEQVRGEIGGKVDWALEGGMLTIRAWDDVHKVAGPFEVELLHVYAGSAMDYDWAVSAVVQKLQNHVHAGDRVPVTMEAGINLSANTQMMLRSLDPQVKFGSS